MILQPGRNVWRIEPVQRAAVLVDAAACFGAVRRAFLKAQESILIVGWDIHSQTRLVGESGKADDGFPEALSDFLSALVRERPNLAVRLLLWDYSALYAMERELFPAMTLRWGMPGRVKFCLDGAVPIGSAQHQKLIVVDDAVAFAGGLDVTVRRWDTPAHRIDDPRRVDPAGKPYKPFHDVHALVDGAAARALAELARSRWRLAAGADVAPVEAAGDPWPDGMPADFTDVAVGIARTQPPYEDQDSVREVEQLFLDAIDAAESAIYIENQFLTCTRIAERLALRLRERPRLEVVIVAPKSHDSWLEARTMRHGRIRFMRVLRESGFGDRVRLLHPATADRRSATDVMIHSKVMIVDDRLLRIGSANLSNRSMGTDTECDLALEATDPDRRHAIARIRNRLVGEHCGVDESEVAAVVARTGSLIAAAETQSAGRRLAPIDDGDGDRAELAVYITGVADPEQPIGAEELVSSMLGTPAPKRSARLWLAVLGIVVLVLTASWHYTPLAELAEPEVVSSALAAFASSAWAPLIVIATFVIGGLVAFPVTILIAATAAAFGPLSGFCYAAAGTLASALVTYAAGARLGKETVNLLAGPRVNRVRRRIARQGVIAIAVIRLIPIAPFTVVNLVAGASAIRLRDYLIGTALGMAPGMLVMSALGHQIVRMLTEPTLVELALLAGAVALWIAVAVGVNVLVSRLGSEKP